MLKQNKFSYRIYYEDTDAGGVVYYANYLKFFERARTDFLRSVNIVQSKLALEESSGFIVRKCQIEYISSAKLDDLIEVDVKITEISAASITMQQKITRSDEVLSTLEVLLVFINSTNFKPKKIPQNIRNSLNV